MLVCEFATGMELMIVVIHNLLSDSFDLIFKLFFGECFLARFCCLYYAERSAFDVLQLAFFQ